MFRSNKLTRAFQICLRSASFTGAESVKATYCTGIVYRRGQQAVTNAVVQQRSLAAPHFLLPTALQNQFLPHLTQPQRRQFAVAPEVQDKVDMINEKFAEAREEIELATEDAETVYFNESCEDARKVAQECFTLWEELLNEVDADTKGSLQRSMGLKIEQLKAELDQLNHLHDD